MEIIMGIIWLISGILNWGLMYAYFSREYPSIYEARTSHIFFTVLGPMALLGTVAFLCTVNGIRDAFKHGFKL